MIGLVILAAFVFVIIGAAVLGIIDRRDRRRYAAHESVMSEINEELDGPPQPHPTD